MLRIGDACIAMDPLSGHGIHEALASACIAAAAIHAYLQNGDWNAVAQAMNDRICEAWEKMMRTAAYFYRLQAAHAATPFWTHAASAYESLAKAARFEPAVLHASGG
jgi:flavin-dependent dehydrogenase